MNQEKVRQMVRLASYEKRGKEDIKAMEYFKGDYVAYNSFLVLLGVSVSLLLFFLGDLGVRFFDDMQRFIELDFMALGIDYLMIWIAFMVVYGMVSSLIYRRRYRDSKRRVDIYKKMLRDLNRM